MDYSQIFEIVKIFGAIEDVNVVKGFIFPIESLPKTVSPL